MKSLTFPVLVLTALCRTCPAAEGAAVPWPPPGVVVDGSPGRENPCLFSPSLAILPDGRYAASYDTRGQMRVKTSADRGLTWSGASAVSGQKWSTLFVHGGALYAIGIRSRNGDIILRRSQDGGHSWTEPVDAASGLLATGKYHCGPTPVLVHNGRVWRAFEQYAPPPATKPRRFSAFVLSAPVESDLLQAASWTRSDQLAMQAAWLDTRVEEWLEGNVVAGPDGEVADILREESHQAGGSGTRKAEALPGIPRFEVAAMLHVSPDGKRVAFDPARDFLHFIGGESKFTIRFDPVSRRYWTLGNKITRRDPDADWTHSPHHQRNVISLTSSADLREWSEHFRPLSYAAGSAVVKAGSQVGFQYMDWQFDGDDLIALCRMSWGGANYHDSNVITFHRIRNFRTLTMKDSPPDLAPAR